MTCTKNAINLDGLVLRVDARTTAGGTATLKGTLTIFNAAENESSTCKFSAKRVSTEPVKIGGCVV